MLVNLLKPLLTSILVSICLVAVGAASADTVTYNALTDFPVIDAGEVPYYRDQGRDALAIDAARTEYRNVFAKAEVVFDGQPGIYQLTLVALAELDGEADYRVSVNGEVVGLASNPEVVEDFSVVRHDFTDIDLPAGAVLAVESLANSNGRIPENGEFAFARGRWTMLEISDSELTLEDPDLSVVAASVDGDLVVGNPFEALVSVANAGAQGVATGVVVSMPLALSSLTLAAGSACNVISGTLECPVAELAAGDSADISIPLIANEALSDLTVVVSVSSDQVDHDEADNALEFVLNVEPTAAVDETGNTNESGGAGSSGEGAATDPEDTPEVATENTSGETQTTTSGRRSGGALSVFVLLAGLLYQVLRVRQA